MVGASSRILVRVGVASALALIFGCERARGRSARTSPTGAAVTSPVASVAAPVTPKVQPSVESRALSDTFANVAQAIRPSVVRLDIEGRRGRIAPRAGGDLDVPEFFRHFFDVPDLPMPGPPTPLQGTGSGVIFDAAGNILTNSHVVRNASKVTVKLADDRSFSARVIGTDPLTDVGVVRLEKVPDGIVAARLGNSDALRIGEWALAIGSPLGMDQTVTVGIISAVGDTGGRFRFVSGQRVRKYIQTDAKINPGNSGGPLVNLEGEVIGINTLINVGPGGSYGFAIPINQAAEVAGVLVRDGRVRYPYIGVNVVSISDAPEALLKIAGSGAPKQGALVASVSPASPAAEAGLEQGDVITRVAGHDVKTAADVIARVSEQKIGETVTVDLVRDGRVRSQRIKVAEYPSRPVVAELTERIGVGLQTVTEPIARSLGLDPKTRGAIVTEIEPGSPAERAGLAAGDVIREIDKKPISSAEDAVAAFRSGKGSRLLRITNASGTRFVSVTPSSSPSEP
jgi:serine protease Do